MRPIGSGFPALLRTLPRDPRVRLIFIQELWPQIVGRELAQNTYPIGLQAGDLSIRVPERTWARHLKDLSELVVSSVNEFWATPVIERISLQIDQE